MQVTEETIMQMRICPLNIIESLDRYVNYGIPTGNFLRAVLENNLKEALGLADENNIFHLYGIVNFLYNKCPSLCWGSPEKVKFWLEMKEKERRDTSEINGSNS
jgi:hypothetical protein